MTVPRSLSNQQKITIIFLVFIGLTCTVGLLYVMLPFRIGVGYDSYFYLSAAQNLAAGYGLQVSSGGNLSPLVHYPPLYPILLSVLIRMGLNTVNAATAMAAALYGLNIILCGWITYRFTHTTVLSLLAGIFMALSPVMVDRYLMAMSEPLFFCLQLISIWCISESLEKQLDTPFLLSSIFIALAYMTRYIAVVLIPTAIFSYLFDRKAPIMNHFKNLTLFSLMSVLPGVVLYWRNYKLTASGTNRSFSLHPIPIERLHHGFETLYKWLFVESADPILRYLIAVILAGIILVWLVKRLRILQERADLDSNLSRQNNIGRKFILVSIIFCGLYVSFLMLSITFFDASTKLNDRILSPLYPLMVLSWIILIRKMSGFEQALMAALVAALIVSYFPVTMKNLRIMHAQGEGFTGKAWRSSQLVAMTRQFGGKGNLFSNEALPLEFLTGKPVKGVPEAYDSVSGEPRPNVDQEIAEMRSQLEEAGSALILFKGKSYRQELPSLEQLNSGLLKIFSSNEGWIYIHPKNLQDFITNYKP